MDDAEVEVLKSEWHTGRTKMVCGTDGGLKDRIGITGYVIYGATRETPLIYGYSAKLQTTDNSSSTRQELLAQLCVVYWLQHLVEVFGEPDRPIRVTLITDSQASILMLSKMPRLIGIKDWLSPDNDITMELYQQRAQNAHSSTELVKVKSQTIEAQDLDETYWKLNKEADELATFARERVKSGDIIALLPTFLPGAKAMCIINGSLYTNKLKESVHAALYRDELRDFLCYKYDWTSETFSKINWEAHEGAMAKFSGTQQVT